MKRIVLSLFLMLSLMSMPSFLVSMELEGQDETGDFLIEEMNEQYPEDTDYFAGLEYMPEEEEEEELEEAPVMYEDGEDMDYEDMVDEDIFE